MLFSPAQASQLALWKQARIGFFEVGAVADDLVSLRELDAITHRPAGSWVRAIALNIGGVNHYRSEKGNVMVTYLAPWSQDENIFCAMGYGLFVPDSQLDEASLEAQLPRLSYRGGTGRAPTGPQELRQRLIEARGLGFAIDAEETYDGVVCVAVPTRIGGALVGAAGISGPAQRMPAERAEEIGHALVESLSPLGAVVQP